MSYRNNKGFTLIELMVVLVIVGILVALMIPNVAGFIASQEINEAAQNVAGALRKAKEIAITKNVSTVVELSDNDRQYVIYRQAMPNENMGGAVSQTVGGITKCYPIETGAIFQKNNIGLLTLAAVSPDSTPNPVASQYITISFTSRSTSNGGTIYLQPVKENTLNKKEKMIAITVSPATGRIRIYQWIGGGWQ